MSFIKKLFGLGKTRPANQTDASEESSTPQGQWVAPKGTEVKRPKKWVASTDPVILKGVEFIRAYVDAEIGSYRSNAKISDLDVWKEIRAQDENFKAALAYAAVCGYLSSEFRKISTKDKYYIPARAETRIPGLLMRKPLMFSDDQIYDMVMACCRLEHFHHENPIKYVLKSVEFSLRNRDVPHKIKTALKNVIKRVDGGYSGDRDSRDIRQAAETLLTGVKGFALPKGPWTEKLLDNIDPKSEDKWHALFEHAMSAKGSAPTKKWIDQGNALIDPIGLSNFEKVAIDWIHETRSDYTESDAHTDLAKGVVWLTSLVKSENMALALGQLGQYCFIKIPGFGQRNKALGNACTVSLARLETPASISELIRLRDKNKYHSTKAAIEKKLEKIADKKNVTLADLEAKSLPDFGFDETGRFEQTLGDFTGRIDISSTQASLQWLTADGTPRKTIPKAVRDNFKSQISELKKKAKDINSVISGQVTALEQSWLNNLSWPASDWQTLYLAHPIRTQMTQSLLWTHTDKNGTATFLAHDGKLTDIKGKSFKPSKDGVISLWHPVSDTVDNVLAWRDIIETKQITQPIRQAHREVYVLTDAERRTNIYSNRFAAHVVRQYQFKALCGARLWHYTLQGQWDSFNIPVKTIRAHNMIAEFHVEAAVEDEVSGTGIYMYLATDQVRFFAEGRQQLPLEQIPPLVFSEVMRDVDLFVAVTSVANDPNWTDGGPDGRFGQYWVRQAFGDLGETAKTRKKLIAGIIPKLAIKDKLKITDKSLEVQGQKHRYHIHFGSGNIMIMPANRYLCIVRGAKPKSEGKVYLPFAGDNLLSVILSKAMLLVDDHKITDPTILSQLNR